MVYLPTYEIDSYIHRKPLVEKHLWEASREYTDIFSADMDQTREAN